MQLTTRDKEIISFLTEQGVATSSQLTDRFFKDITSFRNRIRDLRRAGIVESVSPLQISSVSKGAKLRLAEVLSVSSSDLPKYKLYKLGPRVSYLLEGQKELSEPLFWAHQLRLNTVRRYLEEKYKNIAILTDPEIRLSYKKYSIGRDSVIPDLVLIKDGLEVAIECERNTKSMMVYFNKFISYKSAPFKRVVYFCETKKTYDFISKESFRFEKIGVSQINNPSKVFSHLNGFKDLSSFLWG